MANHNSEPSLTVSNVKTDDDDRTSHHFTEDGIPINVDASRSTANEEVAKESANPAKITKLPTHASSDTYTASSNTSPRRKWWHYPRSSWKTSGVERKRSAKQRPSKYPRPWKSTFLRWGPLSGVFAMFLAISSMFACLGVLVGSNGVAVSNWTVQPSEYLAIFTAIANLAMRYACIQGIIIAWWTRAIRGSTLSKLHWDWVCFWSLRHRVTK